MTTVTTRVPTPVLSGAPLLMAPLRAGDRPRVEAILRATSVFREDEVEVALELFDEAFGVRRAASPPPPPPVSSSPTTTLPAPDYLFVGAFAPDRSLVGYACYGPTPSTDRTYDLYWIAVDPGSQGTGAGTRLIAEVERRLEQAGARLLVIETSSRPEYEPTRHFYVARGYSEAARVGEFYAPGDDRVIYTKRLGPRA
ncbi:MAG TPA: GNAT family N-acetyltransferase [Gemmatimonadaceae bacterium]|nr:GNAT family N-acetyltransferase [Gemmatimonadaceae bacterium]